MSNTQDYQKKYEELKTLYDKQNERLTKIIKQSDSQYKELLKLNEQLEKASNTDPMTGAYNRRYFYNVSQHMTLLAKREKYEISIVMFDIDKFKNINDTHGHDIGDAVIKDLVDLITENTRKTDLFARFGGEEFVLLLNNINQEKSLEFCDKLRVIVEESSNVNAVKYTVSVGIATVVLEGNDNIDDALKKADLALYEAKETGRNKVIVHNQNS